MGEPRWSDQWREDIPAGEAAMWDTFADELTQVAHDVSRRTGLPVDRVFHVKQHLGVTATLTVLNTLPPPLHNGVFVPGARYDGYVRFSSGAVRAQADGILDVRGAALKLVGVAGTQLDGGSATTQDFLFVTTPAVPTDNPQEFLALTRASVAGPLFVPIKLAAAIGPCRAAVILSRLALVKQPRSLAQARFFSAVPSALGPAAMKLALDPIDVGDEERRDDTLAGDIAARLRDQPLRFMLRAQLFIDERRTPIERASVEWREHDAPFHDVATLEIARVDVSSAAAGALAQRVARMSFDPWHGITAHRPLGATQRGRRVAYSRSRAQRLHDPEPSA